MSKRLKYVSHTDYYPKSITPARIHIPQWYKDSERWVGGKPSLSNGENLGLKHCMPFIEALTIGYTILLPCDLLATQVNGVTELNWRFNDRDYARSRKNNLQKAIPVPYGSDTQQFTWEVQTSIKLPPGYSALLTHPLNRFDLPFITMSGVIDGNYTMQPGSILFYVKEGYEGIIEQGTPIIQVIPFKTEDWNLEEDPNLFKEAELNAKSSVTVLSGWYKKTYWKKKNYN